MFIRYEERGGINALAHNGNFFNGDGVITNELSASEIAKLTGSEADGVPEEYNSNTLNKYSKYFKPEGVGNQYLNSPPGYNNTPNNEFIRNQSWLDRIVNGKASPALACTRYNIKTGLSDVYFSKAAFSSRLTLFTSMQHEYVHCSVNFHYALPDLKASERAAYRVTNSQYMQWGYVAPYDIDVMYPPYYGMPVYKIDINRTIRILRPW